MEDAKFAYFRKKVLEHLARLEEDESAEVRKSLAAYEAYCILKGRAAAIGEVRHWKGGARYKKIAPNKWTRVYDKDSSSAKRSIGQIKAMARSCKTSEELLQLVLKYKDRFSDENGHPIPLVRELSEYVSRRNDEIEGGKNNETRSKPQKGGSGGDDGSGGYEPPIGHAKRLRNELKENLKSQIGLHKNKKTGIEANLSGKSIDKMSSDKAIEKSKANGFSMEEHFEVANRIVELYENADLTEIREDKNNSENLKSIKRFDSDVTLKNGTKATAHITVKESIQNGHKIYSVEVMELKKNAVDKKPTAMMDRAEKQTLSANSSIPQSTENSSGNLVTRMYDKQIAFDLNKYHVFENATANLITRIPKEYKEDGVVALIRVKDKFNPNKITDIGIYDDNDWLFLEYGVPERAQIGSEHEGENPLVNDIITKYLKPIKKSQPWCYFKKNSKGEVRFYIKKSVFKNFMKIYGGAK